MAASGTAQTVLEAANQFAAARNMADQRPQHPTSIENFVRMAQRQETEFYQRFGELRRQLDRARQMAAELRLVVPANELLHVMSTSQVPRNTLDDVAMIYHWFHVDFGDTPLSFIEGVRKANARMGMAQGNDPGADQGYVYGGEAPTQAGAPPGQEPVRSDPDKTWVSILDALSPLGAEMVHEQMAKVNLPVMHNEIERRQNVFISRESLPPLLDFVQVKSAFSLNGEVDPAHEIDRFGALLEGSLGYTNTGEQHNGGVLSLEASIPLTCFSLSDATSFATYLSVFAKAADSIERSIWGDEVDRF
jgi:hypothetical protein